jgi:YD repeat-containing protein
MSQRKTVLFTLLLACLVLGAGLAVYLWQSGRGGAARQAAQESNPEVVNANAAAAPPTLDADIPAVVATVLPAGETTRLGSSPMPTVHAGSVDRFEADLRYARFVLRETDLEIQDVFDVPLTRTYNSNDFAPPNPVHAFGKNTNHPYDIAPLGSRFPYTYQMIVLEDGDFLYFDRISKGTSYSDAVYQHTETSTSFYKALQQWNGYGWTTRLADGSQIVFPMSDTAVTLSQGAPIEMRDPQGNRLILQRDAKHNLQQITTPHGRFLKFIYDDWWRIVRAEDDMGAWVRYEYSPEGMLTSAISSSGRERRFSYEGVRMTRVTDERGSVLVQNWYDQGRLVRQKFGNGEVYSYSYRMSPNGLYAMSAIVTLPNGSKKTVELADSVPGFVKQQ